MKIILAFVAGVALASGVFMWFVSPKYTNRVFDHGFHDGYFCGQEDIFEHVASEFGVGDYRDSDGHHPLFEVGRGAALIVERNGVKTLRIHFPQRPNQALQPTADR
jgi:hypothetical protein